MEHLAIMRKSWGLTKKILTGRKIIESRWYKTKYKPWGQIKAGETIYFKDSGEPVSIRAQVKKILQFSDLNLHKVREILEEYGNDDGIEKEDIENYFEMFKDKKYCMLIFLENPQKIEPFLINKKGYGAMASWIIVKNINEIKI
jgi:hypothetical protein